MRFREPEPEPEPEPVISSGGGGASAPPKKKPAAKKARRRPSKKPATKKAAKKQSHQRKRQRRPQKRNPPRKRRRKLRKSQRRKKLPRRKAAARSPFSLRWRDPRTHGFPPLFVALKRAWRRFPELHLNNLLIASASISTSISGDTKALMPSMLVAGRISPKTSPCALPTFSQSAMLVTNIRVRTTSLSDAPARVSARSIFFSVCTACT